jgi:hypothetical protein
LPDCVALYTSNFIADLAAFGNHVLPASARLRSLRELSLATGVPIKAIRSLEPTGAERKLPRF